MGDLIVGNNIRRDVSIRDLSFCQIRVLQTEYRLEIGHGEPKTCELCRINLHTHRWKCATAGIDLPNALNLRQLLLNDRRSFIVKFVWAVLVRGKTDDHDRRIGGVDLAISWIGRKICRKIRLRSIDRCFHIASGAVDVAAQIELNRYRGCTQAT